MNPADITFLVIIAISSAIGIWRGLVKEAVSLLTWLAAIFAGVVFSAILARWLPAFIDNESLRSILAFALLFVAVMFAGTIIGNLMSKAGKAAGLRGTDRVLGALFGLLRGGIIVVIVVFVTVPFAFSQGWYRDSLLVPYILALVESLEGPLGIGDAGPVAAVL